MTTDMVIVKDMSKVFPQAILRSFKYVHAQTKMGKKSLQKKSAKHLFVYLVLNQARAWFPEIVLRKVCVCMYVCMYAYLYVYFFVFPHPREQTFYLKLESSLYTNNKG